jgi:hypothetical protein
VDLALYAGDGVAISFAVGYPNGTVYPLDGIIESQIRKNRTDTDPLVTWSVDDTDALDGVVTLSLTGEQTASLLAGTQSFLGVWDLQFTPTGAEPMTFLQGQVQCAADVTR